MGEEEEEEVSRLGVVVGRLLSTVRLNLVAPRKAGDLASIGPSVTPCFTVTCFSESNMF